MDNPNTRNIAEIELSPLTRQHLDGRISNLDARNAELATWQKVTNEDQSQSGRG